MIPTRWTTAGIFTPQESAVYPTTREREYASTGFSDRAQPADHRLESDTRAALELLSPRGMIVWDDYATSPGVLQYLAEHASDFDRPIYRVAGTQMAIYSRQGFVTRRARQYPFHE